MRLVWFADRRSFPFDFFEIRRNCDGLFQSWPHGIPQVPSHRHCSHVSRILVPRNWRVFHQTFPFLRAYEPFPSRSSWLAITSILFFLLDKFAVHLQAAFPGMETVTWVPLWQPYRSTSYVYVGVPVNSVPRAVGFRSFPASTCSVAWHSSQACFLEKRHNSD